MRRRTLSISIKLLPLLVLIQLFMSGCSSATLVVSEQPSIHEHPLTVLPNQRFGQSFVATYDGLRGMVVEYRSDQDVKLECALRTNSKAYDDLRGVTISLPASSDVYSQGRIAFDAMPNSVNGYYYLSCLVAQDSAALDLHIGNSQTYLQGAIYHNDEASDAQLTFQLLYDRTAAVLTLIKDLLISFARLLYSMLAFLLPGWALLVALWPNRKHSIPEFVGISVGLSLSLYPVLFMLTHLVGLHLGALYTWLPVSAAIIALTWHYKPWLRINRQLFLSKFRSWLCSENFLPDLTWLIVISIVFAVRFIVIRTLEGPMWGDAYQHTVITQLLVDHGGLFSSWEPYAPFATFTYHFGFHTQMAVLHWLTGLDATQSVLWGGQLMNGLAIVTLAPLVIRLTKRRWTAVFAAVIAGTFMSMPMFYANWGRFTQLAGQVILPVAVVLSLDLLKTRYRHPRHVWLGWLVIGGLALTHLRILIYYIVFMIAWMLLTLDCSSLRSLFRSLRDKLSRLVWLAIGGMLAFLPWLLHGVGGAIQSIFLTQISTPAAQTTSHISSYNAIGPLTDYMTTPLWLFLFVGAAVALWNRERLLRMLVVWCLVMLLLTNPAWLHLPGSGVISNFALFIAIYIPASVLIAYLVDKVLPTISQHSLVRYVIALSAILATVYGAYQRRADIELEQHLLLTRPDVRAAVWIEQNTPEDAFIWVNGFLAYADSVVVGSDGAWWMPITANRDTIAPARFGAETWADPALRAHIREAMVAYRERGNIVDPDMVTRLRSLGITHICIGQRDGIVNSFGSPKLDLHVLLESPDYTPIYHEDLVWVFELTGQD